jgi:hypothetical protein
MPVGVVPKMPKFESTFNSFLESESIQVAKAQSESLTQAKCKRRRRTALPDLEPIVPVMFASTEFKTTADYVLPSWFLVPTGTTFSLPITVPTSAIAKSGFTIAAGTTTGELVIPATTVIPVGTKFPVGSRIPSEICIPGSLPVLVDSAPSSAGTWTLEPEVCEIKVEKTALEEKRELLEHLRSRHRGPNTGDELHPDEDTQAEY